MLTPAERILLQGDRTKAKWDLCFKSSEILEVALETNRATFVDYDRNDPGLNSVVFVEGGFERFMDALEPGMVTDLRPRKFDLTEATMRSFRSAVARHRVSRLWLISCGVDDACAKFLAGELPPSVTWLAICNVHVSQTNLLAIARGVARSSTGEDRVTPLARLSLLGVGMSDDCFMALCEVLPRIEGLTLLGVSHNKLTERSLEVFAGVAGRCATLRNADFSHNQIASLAPLGGWLCEKTVLRELYFGGNVAIGDESALALLRALIPHSSVEHIGLVNTGVNATTRAKFMDALVRLRIRKTKALLALSSARGVPRLGCNSAMRRLPNDHLRLVAAMLK